MAAEKLAVAAEKLAVAAEKLAVAAEKLTVTAEKLTVAAEIQTRAYLKTQKIEEKPTAVYARKVHKGGFDEEFRRFSVRPLIVGAC